MELMHKEAKYDGHLHVRDVERWPPDTKAFQFVSLAAVAYSIEELMKVEILQPLRNLLSDPFTASINRLSEEYRHEGY